ARSTPGRSAAAASAALPETSSSRRVTRRSESVQVSAEELGRSVPGIGGGLAVVDVGPRVVEERVVDAGVDVELERLPRCAPAAPEPARDLGSHEAVALGEQTQHRRGELREVEAHLRVHAVEIDTRADVGAAAGGGERELAAHAEADRAHLARGDALLR